MLRKLILLFCGLCWLTAATAQTKTTFAYSYVTLTNNTSDSIQVQTTLSTQDTDFKRGKDWDGETLTLAPYETKQVLWFSRNTDVKADQHYRFDLTASHAGYPADAVRISFFEKGKSVFGSEISEELALPNQSARPLLKQSNFEQITSTFWGNAFTLYARSWLPLGNLYSNFHFVIDRPENINFDTASNQKISILTYNTQLMPFYAGAVDDLNQPGTRAVDIPAKIKQYDVVILEELFDRNHRNTIIDKMQPYYPYHTNVVGHDTSKALTGGVMIFSKWPILKEDQIVYYASEGLDSLAAKGAVYAAINKNGKVYHILGTHLQADGKDEDIRARQKQLQEMQNFIDRLNIPQISRF